jgi:hypothetical protein
MTDASDDFVAPSGDAPSAAAASLSREDAELEKALERVQMVSAEIDNPYLSDAVDALAWSISRLPPAAAAEAPGAERVSPTRDELLAELSACRDLATAASGHDDSAAIADPLQVADHVGLALGIPPEHRKRGVSTNPTRVEEIETP